MAMSRKQYRFWFHYNKPVSKQTGEHLWSVHYRKKCYIVKEIQLLATAFSKINKSQPYAVMQGYATDVVVGTKGKTVTIVNTNENESK
jgi:hypothetical protein